MVRIPMIVLSPMFIRGNRRVNSFSDKSGTLIRSKVHASLVDKTKNTVNTLSTSSVQLNVKRSFRLTLLHDLIARTPQKKCLIP